MRNVLRSFCYRHKTIFHAPPFSNNKLYMCDNSILKEFNTKFLGYRNEYEILSKLKHPNIVKPRDHFYEKNNFYMVLPFYKNGDTWYRIYEKGTTSNDVITIAYKLIKPISYIHKRGLVHLDVKLENYVEGYSHDYIMIDFEHARWFSKNYYDQESLNGITGTSKYMAPEIRTLQYGPTSDVYSLGRVLYTIICKQYPDSKNTNFVSLREKSPELVELVIAMLQPNHRMRPTIFDAARDVNALMQRCSQNI